MQKNQKTKSGVGRTRNFAFLVYPDSAPANWLELLNDSHVPCFVSPLHDKDINPDGSQKKPHYHVLLIYEGVKTVDQVQAVRDEVGGVGWETVGSQRGYVRYLCHLDNPEKAQYNKDDVKAFGGLDYRSIVTLPTDIDSVLDDMTVFIERNLVFSYREFSSYCRDYKPDWNYALKHGGAYHIKEHIKGLAWEYISPDAKVLASIRCQNGLLPLNEHNDDNDNDANDANENTTDDNEICCPECGSDELVKNGKTQAGSQVWKCKACRKRFV